MDFNFYQNNRQRYTVIPITTVRGPFTSLKHLISKTDITAIKYSGQGSFRVKKGTIDKLLFLLKTIGIYP